MCVVPESKKLDDTLKVYNSSSLLEMDAGAAPGRSGGLAGGSFAQRASFSCTAPATIPRNGYPTPKHAKIATISTVAQNAR